MRSAGVLTILGAALLVACEDGRSPYAANEERRDSGVLTIDAGALATRMEAGEPIQLIDVRTPDEFAQGHLEGAINIPLDSFDPATLPDAAGRERVLYCRSDRRSGMAAQRLAEATGQTVLHLEGGIDAWALGARPIEDGAR